MHNTCQVPMHQVTIIPVDIDTRYKIMVLINTEHELFYVLVSGVPHELDVLTPVCCTSIVAEMHRGDVSSLFGIRDSRALRRQHFLFVPGTIYRTGILYVQLVGTRRRTSLKLFSRIHVV